MLKISLEVIKSIKKFYIIITINSIATSWLGVCFLCVTFSVCAFVCFYN